MKFLANTFRFGFPVGSSLPPPETWTGQAWVLSMGVSIVSPFFLHMTMLDGQSLRTVGAPARGSRNARALHSRGIKKSGRPLKGSAS